MKVSHSGKSPLPTIAVPFQRTKKATSTEILEQGTLRLTEADFLFSSLNSQSEVLRSSLGSLENPSPSANVRTLVSNVLFENFSNAFTSETSQAGRRAHQSEFSPELYKERILCPTLQHLEPIMRPLPELSYALELEFPLREVLNRFTTKQEAANRIILLSQGLIRTSKDLAAHPNSIEHASKFLNLHSELLDIFRAVQSFRNTLLEKAPSLFSYNRYLQKLLLERSKLAIEERNRKKVALISYQRELLRLRHQLTINPSRETSVHEELNLIKASLAKKTLELTNLQKTYDQALQSSAQANIRSAEQLKELNAHNEQLNDELGKLKIELQSRVDSLNTEIESLKFRLTEANKQLQLQIQETSTNKEQHEAAIATSQELKAQYDKLIEDNQGLLQETKLLQSTINQLQSELQGLKQNFQAQQTEINQLTFEKTEAELKAQNLGIQNSLLLNTAKQTDAKLSAAEAALSDLQETNDGLTQKANEAQNKLQASEEKARSAKKSSWQAWGLSFFSAALLTLESLWLILIGNPKTANSGYSGGASPQDTSANTFSTFENPQVSQSSAAA